MTRKDRINSGYAGSGIKLLKSASDAANQLGELPPHTDAIVSGLAYVILLILRSSPDDHAELIHIVGRLAAR